MQGGWSGECQPRCRWSCSGGRKRHHSCAAAWLAAPALPSAPRQPGSAAAQASAAQWHLKPAASKRESPSHDPVRGAFLGLRPGWCEGLLTLRRRGCLQSVWGHVSRSRRPSCSWARQWPSKQAVQKKCGQLAACKQRCPGRSSKQMLHLHIPACAGQHPKSGEVPKLLK